MKNYWVVGGEYTDTSFAAIVGGGKEQSYGPFASDDAAEEEWKRRSWPSVDNCNVRFRIVEKEGDGIKHKFWVVGGEYVDTDFHEVLGGGAETWLGPFASIKDAESQWKRLSWESVDNCNIRYRIVEADKAPATSR